MTHRPLANPRLDTFIQWPSGRHPRALVIGWEELTVVLVVPVSDLISPTPPPLLTFPFVEIICLVRGTGALTGTFMEKLRLLPPSVVIRLVIRRVVLFLWKTAPP